MSTQYEDITTAESAVKVFVIPTDEELVIARDAERLNLNKLSKIDKNCEKLAE